MQCLRWCKQVVSKHDTLQQILQYCKHHHTREFYQHHIGTQTRSVSALCDAKFRGKIWIKRVRKSKTRDCNNGILLYKLADWVDINEVVIERQYATPLCETDLTIID